MGNPNRVAMGAGQAGSGGDDTKLSGKGMSGKTEGQWLRA